MRLNRLQMYLMLAVCLYFIFSRKTCWLYVHILNKITRGICNERISNAKMQIASKQRKHLQQPPREVRQCMP